MNLPSGPVIFYDGSCNLCNKSISFIAKRDQRKVFTFKPLQDTSGIPGHRSLVIREGEKTHLSSGAVLRICRHLRFPWNLFYFFIVIPKFLRDPLYYFIACNRYRWFGQKEEFCSI
jgi:predicted DCC family thiol-disulfide oxidoreductase YuxK